MTYHEILNILLFNRVKIFKVTFLSMIFILLILFFIYPVTYRAVVTVLPPDNNNRINGIESILGGQDFSNLLMGSDQSANPQLYAEILKSRTAALDVVKKYNLEKYYGVNNIYEAAKKLDDNLNVDISKERIISVSVDVKTPWLPVFTADIDSVKRFAADLSNSYVQALDSINREKLNSKARRSRIFLEAQIQQTRASLDSAENALMEFQKKNKAVSLPEQLNAAINEAATLKSEIMKTEIEIGMMQNNLREDNKSLLALRDKLRQLKDQYAKMEMGNEDYLMAFKDIPELGKELANLLREVKIQNEIYLLLQQQYYKEKIQENRDVPTVQILDPAIPPLKSSSPRVVTATVMGGILVFLFISLVTIYNHKKYFFYPREMKKENNIV